MTVNELIHHFNKLYSNLDIKWPKTFEVDHETYANVCQFIFNKAISDRNLYFNWTGFKNSVYISLGDNNGIMFKNIELLLKKNVRIDDPK